MPVTDLRPEPPLACDLTAIAPDDLTPHIATGTHLLATAFEVHELPNGYAFRLLDVPHSLHQAADFIRNERLCCPFFTFTLMVEPQGGPIWLQLTGPEGVKPLLQAEMGPYLNPAVAERAGFAIPSVGQPELTAMTKRGA